MRLSPLACLLLAACGTSEAPFAPTPEPRPIPDAAPPDAEPDSEPDAGPDAPPPPACHRGDVTISSAQEAVALANVPCIEGSLHVATADSFELPALREVSVDVTLSKTPLRWTLPSLERVGRHLDVAAREPAHLSLPALRQVGGRFAVHGSSVESIDAARLEKTGPLSVVSAYGLRALYLPELSAVEGPASFVSSGLTSFYFPKLQRIEGDARINGLDAVRIIELPQLRRIAGALAMTGLPLVAQLQFPLLATTGPINIDGGTGLLSVAFPQLATSENITVRGSLIGGLDLRSLIESGAITLDDMRLDGLELPELRKVKGAITIRQMRGAQNAYGILSAPKLEELQALHLADLPIVQEVRMGAVKKLDALTVHRTGRLHVLWVGAGTQTLDVRECEALKEVRVPLHGASKVTLIKNPQLTGATSDGATELDLLRVEDNERLEWVAYSNVTVAETIRFSRNPALRSISIALASVKNLTLSYLPRLRALQSLGWVKQAGALRIDQTGLRALDLPYLVEVGSLHVTRNADLATLSAPELRRIYNDSLFSHSPAPPLCAAQALNAQLTEGQIRTIELGPCQ